MTTTRVTFCGLGVMGLPMATRLLDAGLDVTVWNRSKGRAEPLADRGARVAATPREAADGADIAVTMLSDEAAVRDVVLGPDGLAEGLSPSALLVEMSTIGPEAVGELRSGVPAEVGMLDAPVLGSVPQAKAGELKMFVGGDEDSYSHARPILEAMGTPRHVGALGAGASLKLVVNSTLGAVMVAVGEALGLARALGVDEQVALDVLSGSYVGGVVKSKRHIIEGAAGDTHFRAALAAKDLRLVTEAAERAGVPLPAAKANRLAYEEAVDAGLGDADYGAVIVFLRDGS
ncbi:MAG: NAD(P)-dependent oxidoreductase [Actinomycetota bacterium]